MSDNGPFVDQYNITLSPWGSILLFGVTPALPAGKARPAEPVIALRMSHTTLKMLAFTLTTQVRNYERSSETTIQIPRVILDETGVAREDWDHFWS